MTSKQVRGIAISAWWVLVIIVPICTAILWVAVDHTNAVQDQQARVTNQKFAKSLIVTDHKFHQALEIANQKFAYSINSSACTLRKFLSAARAARLAAVKTATDAKDRRLNQQAADTYKQLIDSQITVPVHFDCRKLIRPKR